MHIFIDSRESCKVFLNIMPGTVDALPADIRHYNPLETFPVISYQMNSRDGKKTEARLFPPLTRGESTVFTVSGL